MDGLMVVQLLATVWSSPIISRYSQDLLFPFSLSSYVMCIGILKLVELSLTTIWVWGGVPRLVFTNKCWIFVFWLNLLTFMSSTQFCSAGHSFIFCMMQNMFPWILNEVCTICTKCVYSIKYYVGQGVLYIFSMCAMCAVCAEYWFTERNNPADRSFTLRSSKSLLSCQVMPQPCSWCCGESYIWVICVYMSPCVHRCR